MVATDTIMKRDVDGKNRRSFVPGQALDVLDTVNKWAEARVVCVDEGRQMVRVTYTYWSDRWDEWLSFDSHRIAARGTKTFDGSNPCSGQRVEARDENGDWLEAEIVRVAEKEGKIFIHYHNYHVKFDAWMGLDRLRPFGREKKILKKPLASKASEFHPAPPASVLEQYARSLEKRGLRLVRVAGDGNCLFRSVAHQMYGNDQAHQLVRDRALDYMASERAYFEPYVAQDFDVYIREKRALGAWGDEPELQALCELYDRPAQVWSFDADAGLAKVLRAFHRDDETAGPPMRLSYFGGGHYDSIVAHHGPHRALSSRRPGELEDAKLRSCASSSGRDEDLSSALAASRRLFDARDLDLESALRASLGPTPPVQDDFVSITNEAESIDEFQAKLDARAAKDHEDTDLRTALALSSQAQEDDDSRLAKLLKDTQQSADTEHDAILAAAIDNSQRDAFDHDLVKAIAASLDQQ